MTIDERFEQTSLHLSLLVLKTGELDKGLNQLTKNLNELTLKMDVTQSYLKESHQQLAEKHSELTTVVQNISHVTTDFHKAIAAVTLDHAARLRQLES